MGFSPLRSHGSAKPFWTVTSRFFEIPEFFRSLDLQLIKSIAVGFVLLDVYFAAGRIGLEFAPASLHVSPVWPAAGIGVGALVILGVRFWPAIFLGSLLVGWTATGSFWAALFLALAGSCVAVLGAYLAVEFAGGPLGLRRAANVLKFVIFAGAASALAGATLQATTLSIGGFTAWHSYGAAWLISWLGQTAAIVVVGPVILLWSAPLQMRGAATRHHRLLEALALIATLLFIIEVAFGKHSGYSAAHYPLAFLCVLPLVWAAFRFGLRATATLGLFLAAVIVWETARGFGVFASLPRTEALLFAQIFIATLAAAFLGIAAVTADRSEKNEKLRETRVAAETLVYERTSDLTVANARLQQELARATHAWQSLETREERNDLLFERNLAGMFRVSADGKIVECNRSFARICGFTSRADMLPLKFEALYFDHKEQEAIFSRLREKRELNGVELCLRRKDGARVWSLANLTLAPSRTDSAAMEGSLIDITEMKEAQEELRRLSASLMHLQDDERRKVARQLNESFGQYMALLRMNLGALARSSEDLDQKTRDTIAESVSVCERCIADIRTLAYLLHPPLLDEMGLVTAIRWYAEGYSQRSGIETTVEIAPGLGRLPRDLEMALFRILQEMLTNVHRHSGSPTAKIRVEVSGACVTLEVRDEGRGMPKPLLRNREAAGGGLGILGMRERVKEFGGRLEIISDGQGTLAKAVLMIPGDGHDAN